MLRKNFIHLITRRLQHCKGKNENPETAKLQQWSSQSQNLQLSHHRPNLSAYATARPFLGWREVDRSCGPRSSSSFDLLLGLDCKNLNTCRINRYKNQNVTFFVLCQFKIGNKLLSSPLHEIWHHLMKNVNRIASILTESQHLESSLAYKFRLYSMV